MASIFKSKKKRFIDELMSTYIAQFNAVPVNPYLKDKLFNVNDIFVNGGIELWITDKERKQSKKERLKSYTNIFGNFRSKSSKRRIIEAEPGYGKSILSLKLAYDWCNGIPGSPLRDVEILIFLRMRQLGGENSIFQAIKRFLLPKNSVFSVKDIQKIIQSSTSVVVLLDGYDEYPDKDKPNLSRNDINRIIMNEMFSNYDVTLTTRLLANEIPATTERLRLTGFDDEAQEEYIRKAVVKDDNVEATMRIKQVLQDNPAMSDLCRVPMFFAMFAHLSHEKQDGELFTSVTSFVRDLVRCFYSHMKIKMEDENVNVFHLVEDEPKELGKIAFEGLCSKQKRIEWKRDYFMARVGEQVYDQYIRVGILVEENLQDNLQGKTEGPMVRFFHKLFCEWFAAYHVAAIASKDGVELFSSLEMDRSAVSNQESETLERLDPYDTQFLYHFAFGMNSVAAKNLRRYLKNSEDCEMLATLCMLEEEGQFDKAMEALREQCSKEIIVNFFDSELLQKSTLQLLECATRYNIPIDKIWINECIKSIPVSGTHLTIQSGLALASLPTIHQIWIEKREREFTQEEFVGLLEFATKCTQMKILKFTHCLLPGYVQAPHIQSILLARGVKVMLYPLNTWYHLDLKSGVWEYRDAEVAVTEEEFNRMATNYREFYYLNMKL